MGVHMIRVVFGYILILLVICSFILMNFYTADFNSGQLYSLKFLLLFTAVTCFVLWFWMLFNLLNRNNFKHKYLWLWMLLLFQWFASIFYFIMVYCPDQKKIFRK